MTTRDVATNPADLGLGGRFADDDPTGEIKDAVKRMNKVRLEALPRRVLLMMEANLRTRQHQLHLEALNRERELNEAVLHGESIRYRTWRRRVHRLGHEADELDEQIGRVRNAYQERVLAIRFERALGSPRRVKLLEGLVLVLIFLVLGLLLYEMLNPDLAAEVRRLFFWIDTACCAVFMTEFAIRLRCAESRRWFWRKHWIDFATSIPIPDALILRTGRLFRVARITRAARVARMVRIVRLIRGIRVLLFFWRGFDRLYEVLNVRLMKKSLALGLVILLIGAAAIFLAEGRARDVEAVDTPLEALWWSFTTVVTGGFGDIHNPNTGAGQLTTVVLVIAGMVVVGVFTATLTALLVEDESEEIEAMQDDLGKKLDDLSAHVQALSKQVAGTPGGAVASDDSGQAEGPST